MVIALALDGEFCTQLRSDTRQGISFLGYLEGALVTLAS
jgi:hypothetical protein